MGKLKFVFSGSLILVLILINSTVLAMSSVNYQLTWMSLSVGGEERESSNYTLSDTLGQSSAIGPSESTNYQVAAGYWHGASELSPAPSTSGCFIATAAYGTDNAKEINILREFRDEVLLPNDLGAEFVSLYYQYSPPIAEFISHHDLLRTIVRECIVDPIVAIVKCSHNLWSK
ncbi:CFI-box-CTERM domain-containing protein [Chloroflexota bacterium]